MAGQWRQEMQKGPHMNNHSCPSTIAHPQLVQFMPTDLSGVAVEADVLVGVSVAFCDYGGHGKAELESLVKRMGGTVRAQSWPLGKCMNFAL